MLLTLLEGCLVAEFGELDHIAPAIVAVLDGKYATNEHLALRC